MSAYEWLQLIVQILSGIAVCIPLVVKLCSLVRECQQAKAWMPLLELTMKLMREAEVKFEDGATRKEYVLAMVQASAEYVSYPIDLAVLSNMIDALCYLTKVVNPPDENVVVEGKLSK